MQACRLYGYACMCESDYWVTAGQKCDGFDTLVPVCRRIVFFIYLFLLFHEYPSALTYQMSFPGNFMLTMVFFLSIVGCLNAFASHDTIHSFPFI